MIAKIEQLLKEVEALHASNAEELEALRIKYLSKKGAINDLMALEACKASTSFRSCSILAIIFLMYCYSVS